MKKSIALFEIVIMVLAGFSFAYFIHESSGLLNVGVSEESKTTSWLRGKILGYLSNGVVSAQEGLWTCLRDLNGSICQEYPAEICEENCQESCIPARRDQTAECRLGTCIDSGEGTCSANVPKLACEDSGGLWTEEEPAECNPGCCLLGGNANYITEHACSVLGDRLGQNGEWVPVENELECLLMAENQEEGACVLDEVFGEGFNCQFVTKGECLGMSGDFYINQLCTNPELETRCEITEETSCFDRGDEVYFKDSCGNLANIYDYNKRDDEEYWKFIIPKEESCSLDLEGNQAECGNCDYLLGSICGEWIEDGDDDEPLLGDYVCRDLSCTDEWGDERKNGESWCAFDSKIGVDEGKNKNGGRSVDLPGSRHYRRACIDGEARTEPCADYRNEVCQESRDDEIGFSSAACRINSWQLCLDANSDEEKLDKCETNSDCFLKSVRLSDFEFDVCAPKHPPGFDLKEKFGGEVGETLCSAGTQTCTVIEVKGFGGWDCKVNCDCKTNKFAETMNNLCISFGDCGGNVNLEGEFSGMGYSVKRAPKLGSKYVSELEEYVNPEKGQHADPLSKEEIATLFGLDPNDPEFESKLGEVLGGIGAGAMGVFAAHWMITNGVLVTGAFQAFLAGETSVTFFGGGAGNVAGGALVGAVVGFIIGKLFGLQGDAMLAVVIGGAVAGAFAGGGAFAGTGGALTFGTFLLPIIIIVIFIAIIMKLLGIGESREIKVAFTCNAWQPPIGGSDCEQCTEGELPCSKYKCQSYGQTCEFVNEGTGEEACIDVSPNDVTSPIISPNYEAVEEPFEYSDVTDLGFKVVHNKEECIPSYQMVTFGVSLNEHGQCKMDVEHTDNFDEMEFYFGESSLFREDHVSAFMMPSLESLGEGGIDPDRRADFDMFVRCQDGSGNWNQNEYAIGFCVSPEDDLTPPILQRFDPESPAYIIIGAEEKDVSFYTNEPSECKWDTVDTNYDFMNNDIGCQNDIGDMTLFGWACNMTLPVQEGNSTDYYLRCKDQPWEEEENRNSNEESVVYQIVKTQDPLIIERISLNPEPNEDGWIVAGAQPVSLELEVETSGGAPVNRYCTYGFGGNNDLARFFESGGDTHRQTFSALFEGDYDIGIRCEDDVGNFVEDSVQFRIDVDDDGPIITRLYNQGSLLYIITNENSECSYSHNSCSFSFGDEDVFETNGRELVHTADFDESLNYYIKCQDGWGNTGQCMTARAGY